jgi:prepilin-type N-terminal cleavage/methylation domain-containing protein
MKHRGMTLLETIVASAMLLVFMALCVHFFIVGGRLRTELDRREIAMQEAANVMERLMARPWDQLSAESAGEASLSEAAQRMLPDVQMKVEITPREEKPPGKRILVTIRWQDENGQWTRPVRLAAWRYQP